MIDESLNILAIIPARGGSKGLPRKNVLPLLGMPLIGYTIEEAKKSEYITRIVVSTDDEEIAKVSLKYGAEVPFMRPKGLAGDKTSTNEVIKHVVNFIESNEAKLPDIICLLQCTSPLRTASDIDNTIEKMITTNSDSAVSVCEVESNPYWTNIFNGNKLEYFLKEGKNITRRQDLPKIYEINGAVYVAKTESFIKYKTLETENTTGYIMEKEKSIDIDNIIDFKLAEFILSQKNEKEI